MYWNIKVYDSDDGSERETIRGLNLVKKDTLMTVFDREGVQAKAMAYDDEGSEMLQSESVNWDVGGIDVPFRPERERVIKSDQDSE